MQHDDSARNHAAVECSGDSLRALDAQFDEPAPEGAAMGHSQAWAEFAQQLR